LKLELAALEHIDSILELHYTYQINNISKDDITDGFVTTSFTKEQLSYAIQEEQSIFIAIDDNKVIAYIMTASWQYRQSWDMFAHMIKGLKDITYLNKTLDINNSYQNGPICIHKDYRGSGLLEKLFNFSLDFMQDKYPILVSFVNKTNTRSYQALKRKLGFVLIKEFNYNDNTYYELVYDTSKRVQI